MEKEWNKKKSKWRHIDSSQLNNEITEKMNYFLVETIKVQIHKNIITDILKLDNGKEEK